MYVYLAFFHYMKNCQGIGVTFPDFPGCVSHGENEEDAFTMATEALKGHLYSLIERGDTVPTPSSLKDIQLEDYQEESEEIAPVIISVSKKAVSEVGKKSVKKTLTIPKWLNDLAEQQSVNYSQVLQEALKEHLELDQHNDNAS